MFGSVLEREKYIFDCSCTDWDWFKNARLDFVKMTETVSAYIRFSEKLIILTETLFIFLNNKLLVSRAVKSRINQRTISSQQGDSVL